MALFCHKITLGFVSFHLADTTQHFSGKDWAFVVSINFYMCLLQWYASHCHLCLSLSLCSWTVLRWWPLYMIISLLIWKPPDSVYCNQLTNSFLYLLMILLLPAHCIIYSEHVNFPLKKSLHCSNIQAQTSQLAAVFYSHNWTLGDLCIKPFPISPELLHKATLMDMGISLSCRIRERWRLWVSYRCLFCWFFFVCFFYEWNIQLYLQ